MDSPVGRRKIIRTGGLLMAGSIAGCGYLSGSRHTTIIVGNHAKDRRAVDILVLDPDGDNLSDARWFGESVEYENQADDDDVEHEVFDQAFEMKRAQIEVQGGGYGPYTQFTYYPYCDDRDDILHINITRDEQITWRVGCDARRNES